MKVTVLPFVLATLGIAAQVSASPVRIYLVSPEHSDAVSVERTEQNVDNAIAHMRWGLATANAPQPVPQPAHHIFRLMAEMGHFVHHSDEATAANTLNMRKHHCGGGMRRKVIAVKNWLREKVGLPPIVPPLHHKFHHGRPMPHRPERIHNDGAIHIMPLSRVHHRHSSFVERIQKALMTLGPWEGRLIAFVLGCGIGSLLRMFYVLIVLTYRSFASRRDEEMEVDVIFAEVEEVPPPRYVDEKIAPEDEASA
ncbi:hypothetical protein DFH11DRAFT_423982 [Phellopilus nigrolimitatus]|nr:hypothetical protein DFH11DRAFT_423982 [Phellopilus nigrolimitatus]